MSDINRSYRIRTEVGKNVNLNVNLDQDYNSFEILSLKLTQEDTYRLQSANYGVIVGRVLANGGFGIPNAKISVFISATTETRMDVLKSQLYPYQSTRDTANDGIRYNLLPDQDVSDCHRAVGTFPSKTFVLDNDDVIEIFEEYYKYTTRTNGAGDYMICGVPVGGHTVHMDLDLSDCGILSQKPRDFYYKGYTVEQFENPNVFKTDEELDTLSQIFSQDQTVEVIPFWGNTGQGDEVGISRCDINVNYKFEPTCVFMGSVFADKSDNGISKRCVPTNTMGAMDELVTGEGTIEMIRKTPSDTIEEFIIKGTELINSNGVWCYQIPMNLDYIMTDEYGNTVATDDPNKGIPTRARVRFRISLHDNEQNTDNYFLSKVLVPNNPKDTSESDFNFGTKTKDTSFRDLFWNNVYSVKSFIPRFQQSQRFRSERFSGIKHTNIYSNNNPMPYNNIRIRLPLMFTILCALIRTYITVVGFVNNVIAMIAHNITSLANRLGPAGVSRIAWDWLSKWTLIVLHGELCPDLEGWYFAPITQDPTGTLKDKIGWDGPKTYNMYNKTYENIKAKNQSVPDADDEESAGTKTIAAVFNDTTSKDYTNADYPHDGEKEPICLTKDIDYLVSCVEMNLAEEYRVINFDFYNDWINGTIYLPRWQKFVRKKRNYFWGWIKIPLKIKGCITSAQGGNGSVSYGRYRRYTQQCALNYTGVTATSGSTITSYLGCSSTFVVNNKKYPRQKCHQGDGFKQFEIFGGNGGVIQEKKVVQNNEDLYVYYAKPCEWHSRGYNARNNIKINLFATDLILLGSLNDCDKNGIPQTFRGLVSTTYSMPTNLALTNLDNEGYLYGINGGNGQTTICDSPKGTSNPQLAPTTAQTFENTKAYYGNDTSQGAKIRYVSLDDYIALTEAPGISWNYSGPGQGEAVFSGYDTQGYKINAWQPGGLFLGLSCFNSETNIKSCVNLTRACEIGVALNPRRELVRGVKYDSITGSTFLFNYYVPTGIISKEDILDEDFRVAFATLNNKRLLADDIDTKTGYVKYSFNYLRPVAFDGLLNAYISSAQNPGNYQYYNGSTIKNFVEDENSAAADIPGLDYDADVKNHTFTRTLETFSPDYYRFRFGISDLAEAANKFAKRNGGTFQLPLFENSFYFYFGLHAGATALDEFNKQYFSSCEKPENVDDGGYYYKQISAEDAPTDGVVVFNVIPQTPTSSYPQYIKVGDNYYVLTTEKAAQVALDIEWDDNDNQYNESGGGYEGSGSYNIFGVRNINKTGTAKIIVRGVTLAELREICGSNIFSKTGYTLLTITVGTLKLRIDEDNPTETAEGVVFTARYEINMTNGGYIAVVLNTVMGETLIIRLDITEETYMSSAGQYSHKKQL